MEPQEPTHSAAEDALRRLEERLHRASDAAERMIAEAAAAAGAEPPPAGAEPPPAGWQVPRSETDGGRGGDLDTLMQVIQGLRDLIPPELQRRVAEALRELLLALRALIDWYLELGERRRATTTEVQNIPIT